MVAAHQSGQHQGRMNDSCRKMSEPGTNAKPPTREGKWGYGTGLEKPACLKGYRGFEFHPFRQYVVLPCSPSRDQGDR